jgi:hypothetical protein
MDRRPGRLVKEAGALMQESTQRHRPRGVKGAVDRAGARRAPAQDRQPARVQGADGSLRRHRRAGRRWDRCGCGLPRGASASRENASPHGLFAPPIKLFMHASPSFYARDVQPPWRSRLSLAPMRILGLDLPVSLVFEDGCVACLPSWRVRVAARSRERRRVGWSRAHARGRCAVC